MIFPTLNVTVERWKFNDEFGVYVSNLGHFKDRQKRNLAYKVKDKGYCAIETEKGFKNAHRLVLITWRPIPNREHMTVDHLNHNKRDNSLSNLEWVTFEENQKRAKNDEIPFKEEKSASQEAQKPTSNDKFILVNNTVKMTEAEVVSFFGATNINFVASTFHEKVEKSHKNQNFKYVGYTFKKIN